jgi:hypothetical protein
MPNQVEPGTVGDARPESGGSGGATMSAQDAYSTGPEVAGTATLTQQAPTGEHETFHGRPVSWVAVGLILAGFLTGGLALVFANWPVFWVGVGVGVLGSLLAAMSDIFEDWY